MTFGKQTEESHKSCALSHITVMFMNKISNEIFDNMHTYGSQRKNRTGHIVSLLAIVQKQYRHFKSFLEKGMASHSSILAWRTPVDRGAWRATVPGVTELDTAE